MPEPTEGTRMTTDELRAAAEETMEWYRKLRREHPEVCGEVASKRIAVCKALLDLLPAESDEPVTEEWLLTSRGRPSGLSCKKNALSPVTSRQDGNLSMTNPLAPTLRRPRRNQ